MLLVLIEIDLKNNYRICSITNTDNMSFQCSCKFSYGCVWLNMSLVVRKPAFCIWENKDADQLRSDREADQRLWFRYTDSTIPLLPKSEISSL